MLVNLHNSSKVKQAEARIRVGSYKVFLDGVAHTNLQSSQKINLRAQGNQLIVSTASGAKTVKKCALQASRVGNEFFLHVPGDVPDRTYQDHLIVHARGGYLILINEAEIDHYVAGVVEAESGSKQLAEYYKVQSVISRTYALSNKGRHMGRGYSLCDQVHCQVYHGKASYNDSIAIATQETSGLVLVDQNINLITAAFSSNCGGRTANSEVVWGQERSYLRSVEDTFCLVMPHAHWEKTIAKAKWIGYLHAHNYPTDDSSGVATFYFPQDKQAYFSDSNYHLKTTDLRKEFQLRSAFFAVQEEKEDEITLIGRGFGHGVGLCQEGAMNMANHGFDYRTILHTYYTNVHLIHLNSLEFFRFEN